MIDTFRASGVRTGVWRCSPGLRRLAFCCAALLVAHTAADASRAANTGEQLGELEEPGQVERLPVEASEKSAPEPEEAPVPEDTPIPEVEVDPGEATTILPDSEAVDHTIEEEVPEDAAAETREEGTSKPTPEAAPKPDPQWSIRWQNAFIVQRDDDAQYQFLFGGRIQNDWGAYAPDDDLERAFGEEGTGTQFRRARLYFQGQFFHYGFFKAEYDFSDRSNGTSFSDVYAGLNLPRIGLLRFGYFKEPFTLQFQNSSNFISFNERSSTSALNPGRNSGVMLNGNFFIRDSTFALAFMRRTDDAGEGFSSEEDYHLTGRLTGLPYFEDGGARLLHIELGYSHQFADEDIGTRYEAGAANDFSTSLVDTGSLEVDDIDLFNAGFAAVEGSLSMQSEFTLSLPRGKIEQDPVFWGAYVEFSWWLTGEHRRYLRGRGVFSRVVPKRRFDPAKKRWGALEIATRYSWLDLSDDGIDGGTLGEWSLAINWVLFSNLRMSNNYVLSHTADRAGSPDGTAHSWVTRFNIDF